jgi:uncharacterized protein YbjT (DUF2867 family)
MIREHRVVAALFGDVALLIIDPADIADVAGVALREAGHGGHVYELTGPTPISPRQQATAIGDALGRRSVRRASRAEARTQLLRFLPEPIADTTLCSRP